MARNNNKPKRKVVVLMQDTMKSKAWHDLSSRGKLVYVHFLMNFYRDKSKNPNNEVIMTQKQIEQYSGLSHPTIVGAIKDLEAAEFLTTTHQGGLERNYSIYELNGRYVW